MRTLTNQAHLQLPKKPLLFRYLIFHIIAIEIKVRHQEHTKSHSDPLLHEARFIEEAKLN